MLEPLLTKENVALALGSALLLWRVIDVFIRMRKKREYELQKLALEITKEVVKDIGLRRDDSFFSYYLLYLDALERGARPYARGGLKEMRKFEGRMREHIEGLSDRLHNFNAIYDKLEAGHKVTMDDLFHRNLNWKLWRGETALLLKKTFRRKYNSI
jgi:hypothetical protein